MKAANSLKADNYRKSGSHATCCRACEHFVDNGPYRRLCRIHQLGPASAYSGAVTPTVAAYNICDKFMQKLRECPFCGGPAIMREFGHHIDPYTGQHTPDVRIGCDAALAAPARNCDRFPTRDEAVREYLRLTEPGANGATTEGIVDWLFAPAEGGDHA